jgi:oligopeptide/dipeptide ABC transporter ATP-binding protein
MEEAPAGELYRTARHPYTRLLFSAVTGAAAEAPAAVTELKTPVTRLAGCAFAERCPLAKERCFREHPEMRDLGGNSGEQNPGKPGKSHNSHWVRCFKAG